MLGHFTLFIVHGPETILWLYTFFDIFHKSTTGNYSRAAPLHTFHKSSAKWSILASSLVFISLLVLPIDAFRCYASTCSGLRHQHAWLEQSYNYYMIWAPFRFPQQIGRVVDVSFSVVFAYLATLCLRPRRVVSSLISQCSIVHTIHFISRPERSKGLLSREWPLVLSLVHIGPVYEWHDKWSFFVVNRAKPLCYNIKIKTLLQHSDGLHTSISPV